MKVAPRSHELERVLAGAGAGETKAQQRFRKLLAKVDRLRQRLQTWRQQRGDVDREIALFQAKHARFIELDRELALVIDRQYEKLNKTEKKKASALIAELAGSLIAQGGCEDLKPLYNRHARRDFDADMTAMREENAEMLRAELEARFGIEIDDDQAGSVEDIRAAVHAQFAAQDAEEEARRASRKKTARQVQAEERRAQEQKSADKSVQEIYRTLARALHPDGEQDAAEQERKTRLMSEVNIAYEAKDLLKLLALQLELEQVDESRIGSLAEEKLRNFSRVLDEQARQLAAELDVFEAMFRMNLGLGPNTAVPPERVIARIRADMLDVERRLAHSARRLELLQDVQELKLFLRYAR